MKRTALAIIAVLCIAAAPASPQATFGIWNVYMTHVSGNLKTGAFYTRDKIRIVRPGSDITADSATWNNNRRTMTLMNNVVVHDQQGALGATHGSKATAAPSTLTCDKLHVDDQAKMYTATGHVHYVQGDTVSDSDTGTLDDATHILTLDGHVHVRQGARSIAADHMKYNTVTGAVDITGKPDVILTMPGGPGPSLATPRPIHIPFGKKPAPKPTR